MAEKYEPKATARHKQMAKSKEQEVEAKKNRYEHEKVALRKYRDERKQALKAVPKEDRPAEKEKTQAEVEKRKALIAKYRDEYKSSSKALKEEKKAKKKAEHESRVQIEFIDEKDSPEPEPEVSPDGTPVKEKRITVEFRSDVPDKDRDTVGK